MNTEIFHVRVRALASLIPPPRLQLSQWIEQNIRLPEGISALPGAVRLWPYQREIADAIKAPACERVMLLKPNRVGGSTAPAPRHPAAWPWPPQRRPPVRWKHAS
jgi:phage terminase large subunit GpA-like protein